MGADDYYAVLGVDPTESLQGIQAAYRKLAKQCHPDRAGVEGKEKFQAIQEAYEVLSDPGKRKEYDAGIDRRSRASRSSGVEPEPVVRAHRPSWFSEPEPLIPSSPPPEGFGGAGSAYCNVCHGRAGRGLFCPVCQPLELMEQDMARFITSFLRAFRLGRL